jgi:VanZ family protein
VIARPVQRSAAGPLAAAYAALVLYASLYPFTGWRWPPGPPLAALLALPWPPWRDSFDVIANMLGYMPLGALLYVAQVRGGRSRWLSLAWAVLPCAGLSWMLEVTQQFLPGRAPSRVDWALNCAGAATGALLSALLHGLGLLQRWQTVRERWFVRDSAGGLTLLALWPVGLLFPTPVPLAMGHVGDTLRDGLAQLFDGVPWAQGLHDLLDTASPWTEPLPPLSEGLLQMLGLVAPCVLALCITRRGWRRAAMVFGLLVLAVGASTLSTALSFGPKNALAWLTPVTVPALLLGVVLAGLCAVLRTRALCGLGLALFGAMVVLVSQAPLDPYFADSLQSWEQGRFIRFHGLALWVGWLWPYAAMVWLLLRLGGSGND